MTNFQRLLTILFLFRPTLTQNGCKFEINSIYLTEEEREASSASSLMLKIAESIPVGYLARNITFTKRPSGLFGNTSQSLSMGSENIGPVQLPFRFVAYSQISGGVFVDGAENFDLGKTQIHHKPGLDAEKRNEYTFHLNCIETIADQTLPTRQLSILTIVEDINESPPVFDKKIYRGQINELSSTGTVIIESISANDDDLFGDNIRYEIIESNFSDYFDLLRHGRRVDLVLDKPIDYETVQNVHLTILAKDQSLDENGKVLSDEAVVEIDVIDGDDQNPTFENWQYFGSVVLSSLDYEQNWTMKTIDLMPTPSVKAVDPDYGINATIVYTIYSTSPSDLIDDYLAVNGNGTVRLSRYPSTLIASLKGVSSEERTFNLMIRASQADDPNRYSSAAFSLRLFWTSEHKLDQVTPLPNINATEDTLSADLLRILEPKELRVSEDAKVGDEVGRIVTAPLNSRSEFLKWTIKLLDAKPSESFLNVDRGGLILTRHINYETIGERTFRFELTANYGPQKARLQMFVSVQNVNEFPPIFDQDNYELRVDFKLSEPTIFTEGFYLGAVRATDQDGDLPLYHLITDDPQIFEINENLGTLKVKEGVHSDFIKTVPYKFTVTATDGGEPQRYGSTQVKLTCVGLPQSLLSDGASRSNEENISPTALVLIVVLIIVVVVSSVVVVAALICRGSRATLGKNKSRPSRNSDHYSNGDELLSWPTSSAEPESSGGQSPATKNLSSPPMLTKSNQRNDGTGQTSVASFGFDNPAFRKIGPGAVASSMASFESGLGSSVSATVQAQRLMRSYHSPRSGGSGSVPGSGWSTLQREHPNVTVITDPSGGSFISNGSKIRTCSPAVSIRSSGAMVIREDNRGTVAEIDAVTENSSVDRKDSLLGGIKSPPPNERPPISPRSVSNVLERNGNTLPVPNKGQQSGLNTANRKLLRAVEEIDLNIEPNGSHKTSHLSNSPLNRNSHLVELSLYNEAKFSDCNSPANSTVNSTGDDDGEKATYEITSPQSQKSGRQVLRETADLLSMAKEIKVPNKESPKTSSSPKSPPTVMVSAAGILKARQRYAVGAAHDVKRLRPPPVRSALDNGVFLGKFGATGQLIANQDSSHENRKGMLRVPVIEQKNRPQSLTSSPYPFEISSARKSRPTQHSTNSRSTSSSLSRTSDRVSSIELSPFPSLRAKCRSTDSLSSTGSKRSTYSGFHSGPLPRFQTFLDNGIGNERFKPKRGKTTGWIP